MYDCEILGRIAREAGTRILSIYQGDHGVRYKEDASPLTLADKASHEYICAELKRHFPDIPVLSEEGDIPAYEDRRYLPRFFLVDPLDGTREFIDRNDEFTVNIALLEYNEPVVGIVYVPVYDHLFTAQRRQGAVLKTASAKIRLNSASPLGFEPDSARLRASVSRIRASSSSSCVSTLDDFLGRLNDVVRIPMGSALKFCRIATGDVDIYPRFGPLMEWDTAAAVVVVQEAGGVVLGLDGEPLQYNKPDMIHTGLMCATSPKLMSHLFRRLNDDEET